MKSIKKILLRIILGLLVIIILVVGLFVFPYFANIVMPWDRANAIEAALEWGGLAELPESANDISVNTQGSMFTREFIIEFDCDPKEINVWISQSGLANKKPLKEENGVVVYFVEGKEGAFGGHVYIDKNKGNIIIDMSWS